MRPCVYCYDSTHSSLYLFFFYRSGAPRDLHSFPTRRSSDLGQDAAVAERARAELEPALKPADDLSARQSIDGRDRKSTRLNSSHVSISYAVFCLKKKKIRFYKYSSPRKRKHISSTYT